MGKVIDFLRSDDRSDYLKKLQNAINIFTKAELGEYLNNLEKYAKYNKAFNGDKNFYDAVWGTIVISESEVRILNSPLLQRLRDIKQLGLANLLYSSADHSRFSHTIGVLNVSSQMFTQVKHELEKKELMPDDTEGQIIRLAAIFHDVGHMFCSHASERYFQTNEKSSLYTMVFKIRNEFYRKLKVKPSLSEILSVLIVNSESVQRMLGIVSEGLSHFKFSNKSDQDKSLERISCLILGIPYSKKSLPYSQIISGSIDADKLDYLKRDSHMTGVPVAVDMSRIFQKLRVVQPNKPIENIVVYSGNAEQREYVMGIAPAAINTVDQLCVSRFNMYENIYFHQKVLTAEEMLRYAVELIDRSTVGIFDDFSVIMNITDSVIINKCFEISMRQIEPPTSPFEIKDKEDFDRGCSILAQLKNRKLFKRCLSINKGCLTGITQVVSDFYTPIFGEKEVKGRDKLLREIINEIKKIKEILHSNKSSEVFFCEKTDVLIIFTPDIGESASESNITIADKKSRNRNEIFMADRWLMSRTTRKPQNYIITYEEDRYIGFIAAEKVLYSNYGIRAIDMDLFDRDDDEEIIRIKECIKNAGYYDDAYVLIPDTYIRLREGSINQLITSWQTYLRFDLKDAERKPIDSTFLSSYIMQFYRFEKELGNFDLFVDGCIDLLQELRLINKNDILKTLKSNLKKVSVDNFAICNLGTVQDSSAQLSYQINEINAVYKDIYEGYTVTKMEDILSEFDGGAILIIEDAFSSGVQISSIFEEYMGVPVEKRKSNETHVKELDDKMKEKLKNTELYFSFIFYNEKNKDSFISNMNEIGLTKINILSYEKFPQECFGDEVINSNEKKQIVKKYFEAAGKMLMEEKAHTKSGGFKSGWNKERLEESVLGYKNAQQLIVFPWNTPTYTLTALWMSSRKNNWVSLFQRIDK